MRVRFKVNLGSNDGDEFGLDVKQCTEGSQVTVSDKAGAWLVARNIATEVVEPVRGVSAPPAIGEASKPTIKAEPVVAKAKQPLHKEA